MTFLEEAVKTDSQKIVLYEYDIGEAVDTPTNIAPSVFLYQFDKSATATSSSLWPLSYYYNNPDTSTYNNIKSLKVDNANYTLTTSLPLCKAQRESFYFDKTNQKLYVHFDELGWWLSRIVRVGAVSGVVDNVDFTTINQSFYEDIRYKTDFLSLPTFTKKKDPLFFGRLNVLSFSVQLQNADGFYDNFTDLDTYGQRTQVLLGFAGLTYSEYRPLLTNYIKEPSWGFESISIKNQDQREILTKQIPERQYLQTDFAGLKDDNDGKYKPLCWGPALNAPTFCLNETTAGTNAIFSFLDTVDHAATSLDTVYAFFQDETTDVTGSVLNIDLAAGTFELPVSIAFDGTTLKKITCDFDGFADNNGFDVMADAYNIYADIPFNSANYNLSEWAAEKTRSKNVGVYIGKPTEIKKIFSDIALSMNAVWFIQDNGLITMRVFYEDRIPKCTMKDFITDPAFSKPVSEHLSSVTIEYSKDQSTASEYSEYLNTDLEQISIRKYKKAVTKSFKTYLTSKADAISISSVIMNRAYIVQQTVKRKTKLQYFNLELMDFVIASHNRQSGPLNYGIYEIIGKTLSLSDMTIDWTLKKVSDYTVPVYIQGIPYGPFGYGHRAYGSTRYLT